MKITPQQKLFTINLIRGLSVNEQPYCLLIFPEEESKKITNYIAKHLLMEPVLFEKLISGKTKPDNITLITFNYPENIEIPCGCIHYRLEAVISEKSSFSTWRPPGHFYSAIGNNTDIDTFLNKSYNNDLKGIDLNSKAQYALLKCFIKYYKEFNELINSENSRYIFKNSGFSGFDAISLYSFIRHFNPSKIIEVGSGFSTCLTLDTIDESVELTCIEPFPEKLQSLTNKKDFEKNTLIVDQLQNIRLEKFKRLKSNDILFIDSTHVCRTGSDVNYLFFEILPILKPGVIIHFHDIFYPFEYPEKWIKEGRWWNEIYLLRAYLSYNRNYEILFFCNYIQTSKNEFLIKNIPLAIPAKAGSIWIRKK